MLKKIVTFVFLGVFLFGFHAFASDPVNINTASAKELSTLSGIGKKTSAKIILYREEKGSFKTIDDLTKVQGIGKKTVDKNRDSMTVGEPTEPVSKK